MDRVAVNYGVYNGVVPILLQMVSMRVSPVLTLCTATTVRTALNLLIAGPHTEIWDKAIYANQTFEIQVHWYIISSILFKILQKWVLIWIWQHVRWLCHEKCEDRATSPLKSGSKSYAQPWLFASLDSKSVGLRLEGTGTFFSQTYSRLEFRECVCLLFPSTDKMPFIPRLSNTRPARPRRFTRVKVQLLKVLCHWMWPYLLAHMSWRILIEYGNTICYTGTSELHSVIQKAHFQIYVLKEIVMQRVYFSIQSTSSIFLPNTQIWHQMKFLR